MALISFCHNLRAKYQAAQYIAHTADIGNLEKQFVQTVIQRILKNEHIKKNTYVNLGNK